MYDMNLCGNNILQRVKQKSNRIKGKMRFAERKLQWMTGNGGNAGTGDGGTLGEGYGFFAPLRMTGGEPVPWRTLCAATT